MKRTLRRLWRIISFPFRAFFWVIRILARGLHNRIVEIREFFSSEVDDSPVGEALGKAFNQPGDILIHLDALRKHLLRAVVVLLITTFLSFTFFEQIMGFLTVPLKGGMASLVTAPGARLAATKRASWSGIEPPVAAVVASASPPP